VGPSDSLAADHNTREACHEVIVVLRKCAVICVATCLALLAAAYVMWEQISDEYTGRVNFLVLDFTDEQTTDASRTAAERVGLGRIFEETGATGVVLVVDGRSKEVTASIAGSRDVAEYRAAIDAALE
jgi:capsular polysaccharide biosynthesis protein